MTDLLTTSTETDKDAVNEPMRLLTELHNRGVTYQAVANLLGVNWRTIHRWSRGETHPTLPGLVTLVLAAQLHQIRDAEEAARQPVAAV